MRSRYSAYATGQVLYIQKTTHPKNKQFDANQVRWQQILEEFCRTTKFLKLEVLATGKNWVFFQAHLEQKGKPYVLQEKSHFEKINSEWLYLSGEITIVA